MATWDVFRELDSLRKEIDQAFRGFGIERPFGRTVSDSSAVHRFPLVNLSEDDGQIYVQSLLPGVDPKDIELTVLRNTLTISGECRPYQVTQGQVVHRNEVGEGTFSRTIELPVDVDAERVTAEAKDGLLLVSLTKAEHAKPKRIEIKPQ